MFNISNQIFEKTQNVLFLDKVQSPHQITDVVASEVFYVLKQYFEIDPTDYRAKIHVQKNGAAACNGAAGKRRAYRYLQS